MSEAGLRPLGDRLYVQRVREEKSRGGIILLQDYRARRNPRLTMAAKPDFWPARVLAIGDDVDPATKLDLSVGDEILVYTFNDDVGKTKAEGGMYTGVPSKERDCVFIRPSDVVCIVEREAGEAFPPPTSMDVDQDPAQNYAKRGHG